MKRKIVSCILAVATALTMCCMPAFADTPATSGSTTFDNNNGEATDTFDENGDNKTTVDEYYTVTKAAGTDDGTLDYYVVVSWERTNGNATSEGDTYHWDASEKKYVRTAQTEALKDNTPATADITIKNQSNAKVDYSISYETADGYDTTESMRDGSVEKSGELNAYTDSITTIEGTDSTTGKAEYSHADETVPSVTYKGQVKLNTQKTAIENALVGTYTVNITAAPVEKQTVTSTVNSAENTVLIAQPNPAEDITKSTEVTFPKEMVDLENGSKANLTVETTSAVEATSASKSTEFTVSDNNNKALGALNLTLKVDGKAVDKFEDSNGNDVSAVVKTYVAKGIVGFAFSYNGTAFTVVDNKSDVDEANEVWYDSETGELVFATTHFSTYVIEGRNEAYIEETNTAYEYLGLTQNLRNDKKVSTDAIKAADGEAYTITLLKDVDLSEITGADSTCEEDFDLTDDTLDLNGYTIHTAGPNRDNDNCIPVEYTGSNFVIKNGTFTVGKTTDNSYALYLSEVTNSTVEYITAVGGINCSYAEATMKNVISQGTSYYAIWAEHDSKVTVESGTYSATSAEKAVFNTSKDVECYIKVKGGTITAGDDVSIANNKVEFTTDSTAVCNKNPGDEFVAKPYGFIENAGVWTVAKTYNYKVSYKEEGYVTFDSWADVVSAVSADSSKVYINLSFYKSANSTCINAYTPLSDTETKVGFNYTAPEAYNYGTGFFGGEASALTCFFKYETADKSEYFKTESEADTCVGNHSGATEEAV